MASKAGGNKGNPASKRIGNARRKARRQESWTRAQKRHDKNRSDNERQHAANVAEFGPSTAVRRKDGNHGNGNPTRPSRRKRAALRAAKREAA